MSDGTSGDCEDAAKAKIEGFVRTNNILCEAKAAIDKLLDTGNLNAIEDAYKYFEGLFFAKAVVKNEMGEDHVDAIVYSKRLPDFVRWWVIVNRLPATWGGVADRVAPLYPIFANHKGERVQVVMASRLGDVGITTDLKAGSVYKDRINIMELTDWSRDKP